MRSRPAPDDDGVAAATAGDLSLHGHRIEVADLHGAQLAPDVVHLTYLTVVAGRASRRSSVWRRSGDGWQLWFHQGTPLSSGGAGAPAGE